MTSIDAMRTMATRFDEAGHALAAADDIRREVSFLSERVVEESARFQGKDFDLVLDLTDAADEAAMHGREAFTNAIAGAREVFASYDTRRLPVHIQSRIEIGGARELLDDAEATGWGANLEVVADQFLVAAKAIEQDVTARVTQQF